MEITFIIPWDEGDMSEWYFSDGSATWEEIRALLERDMEKWVFMIPITTFALVLALIIAVSYPPSQQHHTRALPHTNKTSIDFQGSLEIPCSLESKATIWGFNRCSISMCDTWEVNFYQQ